MRTKIVNADLCRLIHNAVHVSEAWNDWLNLIEKFMSAIIFRVKVKPFTLVG